MEDSLVFGLLLDRIHEPIGEPVMCLSPDRIDTRARSRLMVVQNWLEDNPARGTLREKNMRREVFASTECHMR